KKAQEKAEKKAQQRARINAEQEAEQNNTGSSSQNSSTQQESGDDGNGSSSEQSGSDKPQTFGGKMQKRADNTNSKVLSGLSKAVNIPLSYAEAALRCTPKGAPWSSAYKECVRELTNG